MKNSPFKNGLSQGFGIFLAIATLGVITAFAANWYDSYIFTTGEVLSATKLNTIVKATVPVGAIMAFNGINCPDGWDPADGVNDPTVGGGTSPMDLRGAFLRGMNGNLNSRDIVRALGDYQADDFKSHTHGGAVFGTSWAAYMFAAGAYSIGAANQLATGGNETRPKNVAILYCVKQ